MKRLGYFLASLLLGVSPGFSQSASETTTENDLHEIVNKLKVKYLNESSGNEEFKYRDITTTKAGELGALLGDDITAIDSLVVRGPINDADFKTMWHSTYFGKVKVLNLENATIENNKVPDRAFWDKEQIDTGEGYYYSIDLRRIILPEAVEEIGEWAFFCSMKLTTVNIPSSLKIIGRDAFYYSLSLKIDKLVFPEGFEEIGDFAFFGINHLCSEIIFPSTMKSVGNYAFNQVWVSSVTIPEGLESIGQSAFQGTKLEEVVLPHSCVNMSGDSQFALNYLLKKLHISNGLTEIPAWFADNCLELKDVSIPTSVKSIKHDAFNLCEKIEELDLPEGLESIATGAFTSCRGLKKVVFPSTLSNLASMSCDDWQSITEIYSKSIVPPTCDVTAETTPFGKYTRESKIDTPLYVPVGSAEVYKTARGWENFVNIIELDSDKFPSGIEDITVDGIDEGDEAIYDLSGRRVSNPAAGQIYIKGNRKFIQNR